MRYVSRAALLFLFVLGACLAIGCSEKSTEPKDSPPPSTVMKHIWSERFGDASGQYAQGVAADTSGNMIVTVARCRGESRAQTRRLSRRLNETLIRSIIQSD